MTSTDSAVSLHPARSYASGLSVNEADAGESANISANDFLTLLVTEMKNQDPTADTDPNEYINQLVQVNSLEQLISINQTLTADSTLPSAHKVGAPGTLPDDSAPSVPGKTAYDRAASPAPGASGTLRVSGNLTAPGVNVAAQRIAGALGSQVNRQ
jgi:flagellar basal-body rod modification protein FlgD